MKLICKVLTNYLRDEAKMNNKIIKLSRIKNVLGKKVIKLVVFLLAFPLLGRLCFRHLVPLCAECCGVGVACVVVRWMGERVSWCIFTLSIHPTFTLHQINILLKNVIIAFIEKISGLYSMLILIARVLSNRILLNRHYPGRVIESCHIIDCTPCRP